MNSPLSVDELNSILNIMEQMVIKAKNSDWPALTLLDRERRAIILGEFTDESGTAGSPDKRPCRPALEETAYNKPPPGQNKETDISSCSSARQVVLERIMEIDQYLNDTLTNARKSLLMESRQHNDQIKAKKYYDIASLDYS